MELALFTMGFHKRLSVMWPRKIVAVQVAGMCCRCAWPGLTFVRSSCISFCGEKRKMVALVSTSSLMILICETLGLETSSILIHGKGRFYYRRLTSRWHQKSTCLGWPFARTLVIFCWSSLHDLAVLSMIVYVCVCVCVCARACRRVRAFQSIRPCF